MKCTSSLLLGDVSMTSSASLNAKGLSNVAGLLGIARSVNVAEL